MSNHRNKTFKKLTEEDLNDPKFVYIKGYIDNIFRNKRYAATIEAYGFLWLCEFTSETCYAPTLRIIRQFKLEDTIKPGPVSHLSIAASRIYAYISTQKAVRYMTEFMRVATDCVDKETKICVCSESFLQMRGILQSRYPTHYNLGATFVEHVEKLVNMRTEAATDGNVKYYILPDWEFTYNVRQVKGRGRVMALRGIMKLATKNVYVVPHLVRSRGNHVKLLINP